MSADEIPPWTPSHKLIDAERLCAVIKANADEMDAQMTARAKDLTDKIATERSGMKKAETPGEQFMRAQHLAQLNEHEDQLEILKANVSIQSAALRALAQCIELATYDSTRHPQGVGDGSSQDLQR